MRGSARPYPSKGRLSFPNLPLWLRPKAALGSQERPRVATGNDTRPDTAGTAPAPSGTQWREAACGSAGLLASKLIFKAPLSSRQAQWRPAFSSMEVAVRYSSTAASVLVVRSTALGSRGVTEKRPKGSILTVLVDKRSVDRAADAASN